MPLTELDPALAAQLDQLLLSTPAEVLAYTDAADVVAAIGALETEAHELELVGAWARAGNVAALNAVAVHIPGRVGAKAHRALRRVAQFADTEPPSDPNPT